jgi:tetratricopeptide (TPR) repeat protein
MSSQPLGPYIIGERLGTAVWLAEDTRNGKKVAIKLLTKSLPKEPVKREAMVRDLRVAAALYHPFLVTIHEIAPIGDNLVMVMDAIDGQGLTKRLGGQPVDRPEFFRLALQLASAVKFLHTKGILHGNLNGDSVLVTPEGQVKLGGLNMTNLHRREHTSVAYQQKGGEARFVSYMAPEEMTSQHIEEKSDIFSLGVLLYEMATGKLPFGGATAPDIARAIVEGQPASPRSVNSRIDNAVIGVLGPCLFKDPQKRQKDVKAIVEAIEKIDSEAAAFAAQFEKRVATSVLANAPRRRSILFIADVAGFEETASKNPEAAARAAARMQQILGESVYLFDGKVIDPFGTRMVAELPTIDSAIEAGRKGEFDFSPGQQEGSPLDVRMLLHAGQVEMLDGVAGGPSIERAFETLAQLTPNTLFISEEFVKAGRPNVRLRDAGARAGVKLYTIAAEVTPPPPTEVSVTTAELEAEEAEEAAAILAAATTAKRRTTLVLGAVVLAGLLVVVVLVMVMLWMRRGSGEPVAVVARPAPVAPSRPSAAHPREVFLVPFTIEGPEPDLPERANAIRLGSLQILRTLPELRVVDAPDRETASFSAVVRAAASGPEIVPAAGTKSGQPAALLDSASGIRAMVGWVLEEVDAEPRTYAATDALNSFADAAVARSLNDNAREEALLRAAMTADPSFLPAQLMAMEFFSTQGKEGDVLAAARQVMVLDPGNLEAVRKVARASLMAGDLQQSFAAFDLVLRREPKDAEALNLVARYAVASGDTEKFTATLARMRGLPAVQVSVHEPDSLTAAGRIETAIQRYYTLEEKSPDSASLALKIGRLSVLRHSLEMAASKLDKLAKSDPLYGFHMLSAYIAAEKGERDVAQRELETALGASVPGDDAWTSAAEVHAVLNDTPAAMAALEKAAQRKEPTAAYVLSHPLFRYLENDPRFQKLKETLLAQQQEIRAALAQVH